MTDQPQPTPQNPPTPYLRSGPWPYFVRRVWLIGKNLVGWMLILSAPLIGSVVPVPVGLPLFLIGFAMITLPGKRRLTTRILSGRPMDLSARRFTIIIWTSALLLPLLGFWAVRLHPRWPIYSHRPGIPLMLAIFVLAIAVIGLLTRLLLVLLNMVLHIVPRLRRRVRPWMRRHGIRLLPPIRRRRRRGRNVYADAEAGDEILDINPQQREQARQAWSTAKKWAGRWTPHR